MTRYICTIILVLSTLPVCAELVHIPDPNLRAAISEALDGAPITREAMKQLTGVDAGERGVTDLTGLEHAINLTFLGIQYSPLTDLSPIAGLTRLDTIYMWATPVSDLTPLRNLKRLRRLHASYGHQIVDISPLASLTELEALNLSGNKIVDISPLANLKQLTELWLMANRITDVRPLAGLTELRVLEIEENKIFDHSPLDHLSLDHFTFDQTCDMPPLPLQERLENRNFPSVFTAWGGLGWSSVINQPHLSDLEQMAQHDLYWCCLMHGGKWVDAGDAVVISGYLDSMVQNRDDYIAQNPNMIFLVELRAVWDDLDRFPPDSDYWLRDEGGKIYPAWDMGLLNLNHPGLQKRLIDQAVAVSQCGLYDGIFVDGWSEWHQDHRGTLGGAEAILKGIRERVHPDFLILVNTNQRQAPVSAPYINGLFMETGIPGKSEDPSEGFTILETTLSWAETNLRTPRINSLETDVLRHEPLDSPTNLRYMRAATTLNLTFSDGYVLFRIDTWEGKHMHWHYWYDFWDADLGRPIGPKSALYDEDIPGLYIREYTNGWAVYNHSGTPQIITLPEKAQGVASGWLNTQHALPNLDGEMYLRVKPKNPADVNRDGVVNILDLTLVAQTLGTDRGEGDVNRDGVVNIMDLVFVANQF